MNIWVHHKSGALGALGCALRPLIGTFCPHQPFFSVLCMLLPWDELAACSRCKDRCSRWRVSNSAHNPQAQPLPTCTLLQVGQGSVQQGTVQRGGFPAAPGRHSRWDGVAVWQQSSWHGVALGMALHRIGVACHAACMASNSLAWQWHSMALYVMSCGCMAMEQHSRCWHGVAWPRHEIPCCCLSGPLCPQPSERC